MFTIRAVTLDHYMSKSIAELNDENISNFNQSSLEPVIRIFGSTPDGQKSCVHVHGAFPYIYVPYKGGENPQRDALILSAALDEALKSTNNQPNYRFICKVSVVAGIPLYGYHGTARQFFKIFFYNPYSIKKASDLLLNGAILGQKLQPHEAHIPYTLQFMIDYDIYGMSLVSFSKIKFRKNLEHPESLNTFSRDMILPDKIKKITCSYYEVDALVTDIIRKNKAEMTTSNPGLQAIWEDERIRRRNRNKPSQMTDDRSQSRKAVEISATEEMYKNILVQKLAKITCEDIECKLDASQFSYPASLSENSHLENSMLCEGEKYHPEALEEDLDHIRSLIDISVLGENNTDLNEINEEVEGAEADSVLGKDLKKGEEEGEEVELEEDDGGDMTQSLEDLLNIPITSSNDQSQEDNCSGTEAEFWRKMAGKIFQFDGVQDSSSDTDAETTFEVGFTNKETEKHFSNNTASPAQESLNTTLSSLSESDLNQPNSVSLIDLPIDCSGYSLKGDCLWLPPNDDTWNWDKNDIFADCFPCKNQTLGGNDLLISGTTKSSDSLINKDFFENYFPLNQTECFSENFSSLPSINSINNLKSVCGISSSSVTSALPNENTNILHYANSDISTIMSKSSIMKNELNDSKKSKSTHTKTSPKRSVKVTLTKDLKNFKEKICREDRPKETSCLTLKEYLKDFGEVVSVDFKNFNEQEMVVVEYKPVLGKSNQNKFLIKPLNKFLENWNTAEKKINAVLPQFKKEKSKMTKYFEQRNLIEDGDGCFPSSSPTKEKTNVKSTKNDYVLQSMKVSPENPEFVKMYYTNKNVKEDVISHKTSQLYSEKLLIKNLKQNLVNIDEISKNLSNFSNTVKDQNGNHISSCSSQIENDRVDSDEDSDVETRNLRFFNRKRKSKKSVINNLFENKEFIKAQCTNEKKAKISNKNWKENPEEKHISDVDFKLMEEINSCFEKYFKNIIKINNCFNEKCKNLFLSRKNKSDRESEVSSSADYSDVHKRKEFIALYEDNPNIQKLLGVNSKSIKFITQFLSAFSEMSQFSETPPLDITIKVGDRRNQTSAPVHLSLRSRSKMADEERNSKNKKRKRKIKVENVDGPADNSSTDDSTDNEDGQSYHQDKVKGGKYYKSLNVVLCKSSGSEKVVRKRKRKSSKCASNFDDVLDRDDCSSRKSSKSEDSLDVCSQSQTEAKQKVEKQSKSKKRNSRSDLTEFKNYSASNEVVAEIIKEPVLCVAEQGQISHPQSPQGSSATDPTASTPRHMKSKMKIPQGDVDVSSSEDENFISRIKGKNSTVKMKHKKKKIFAKKLSILDDPIKTSDVKRNPADATNKSLHIQHDGKDNDGNNLENSKFEEVLDDILNKTCYKIPSKWSEVEESKLDVEPSCSSQKNFGYKVSNDDDCKSLNNSSSFKNDSIHSMNDVAKLTSSEENKQNLSNEEKSVSKNKEETDSQLKSWPGRRVKNKYSLFISKIIVPTAKPPSRKKVFEFLLKNENFKSCSEIPHYSNPNDVSKPMEIGPVVLKVETNAAPGLKVYKSALVMQGVEDRRNHFLNPRNEIIDKVRSHLVSNKRLKVIPLRNPPFSSFILKQLKPGKKLSKSEEEKSKKIKLYVPLSPDQDSHSEEEIDLSATIPSLSENYEKVESDTTVLSGESSKNIKNMLESVQNETVVDVENSNKDKDLKKESKFKCGNLEVIAEESQQFCKDSNIEKPTEESKSSGDSRILMPSEECKNGSEPLSKAGIRNSNSSFGIKGITLDNTFGFSHSVENFQKLKLKNEYQHVTMLIVELHVETRKDLLPDPKFDSIKALFYTVTFDSPTRDQKTGIIVVGDQIKLANSLIEIYRVQSEPELFHLLIDLMKEWDPDILAGYEIEMHSWGYLVQRGIFLEINLLSLLARVQTDSTQTVEKSKIFSENNELELEDIPRCIKHLRIVGRIVLDIWRLLRHEVNLTNYTFQNVMYHVTHERHPLISFRTLTDYWKEPNQKFAWITAHYYIAKVKGQMKILEQLDFINRTSELARLFGIQFIEVLSRGSQFRVESMMLRLAKSQNYIPVSPSIKQRAEMRAPASLPLILEPESLFYTDPVIVLDFQSLYPSMIIAYNYCFSTCLGRLENLGSNEPFEFGCTQLQILAKELKDMENDIHISPAGVAFVKANVRKGVLPSMLEEILETRLMVKKSMKENKNEKLLLKVLHARQLGLKLIANVTYGYTAANFSGRMPCIEVGDSVVSKGRETLHRAIELIKSNPRWGAKVVYGDTDSIFVLTPKKSREEAFEIGAEIAEAVTQNNPKPVKLKLEKVYQPCILQTKKRYVGYMFESPNQKEPIFEAKGIETVRRDGCPAVRKILQKALQILFDTKDLSIVKKYTIRQFIKLFQNRVNIQDLIFAKEYRGRAGYRPGACVPALELAKQRTRHDKRAEPRVKERVPYVIVNGVPGVPLIKLVRSPTDLLDDPSLRINAIYYITKAIIPPMHRCFSLFGVDVSSWYLEMPKKEFRRFNSTVFIDHKKRTISQYFVNTKCALCPNNTNDLVCNKCKAEPQSLAVGLIEKMRTWERRHHRLMKICQSCYNCPEEVPSCQSFDCPVLFRRIESFRDLKQIPAFLNELNQPIVPELIF